LDSMILMRNCLELPFDRLPPPLGDTAARRIEQKLHEDISSGAAEIIIRQRLKLRRPGSYSQCRPARK
jgi:hypothetical protein